MVFLDLSAAFDVMNRRLLFAKLEALSILHVLWNCVATFINQRLMRVRVADDSSPIASGASRGSVPQLLLFSICANELTYA